MMKFYNILSACLMVVLTSCSVSKAIISKSSDLAQYEYASIINDDVYHIPAELMPSVAK